MLIKKNIGLISKYLVPRASKYFDAILKVWQRKWMHKSINRVIVIAFLLGIVLTLTVKLGWLNYHFHNDFIAVEFAFTILLISELAALIFVMPRSVGMAMGKQFEILALILLRSAFKEFSLLEPDFTWEALNNPITKMIVDAFGSLFIFIAVGVYYKSLKRMRLTENREEHLRFKAFKKMIKMIIKHRITYIKYYKKIYRTYKKTRT